MNKAQKYCDIKYIKKMASLIDMFNSHSEARRFDGSLVQRKDIKLSAIVNILSGLIWNIIEKDVQLFPGDEHRFIWMKYLKNRVLS